MAHPLTFPALGFLALAGVGLGLHLGNASVSEINPLYFQEPPTRFHSDLAAYQSPASTGYSARADAASRLELGTGCIGCRTYPEEYFPRRDPAVESAYESGPSEQAPVQLAVAESEPDPDLMKRQADLDRLQRYSSYAVQAVEAQEREPIPATASAEAEATAIQGDEVAPAD
jgi:hypothetical protein